IPPVFCSPPVARPFWSRVPGGLPVQRGQRVLAPLRGARRVGLVLRLHDGDETTLKPLLGASAAAPTLHVPRLDRVQWIAHESLSSVGSTCAALLPPPLASEPGPS